MGNSYENYPMRNENCLKGFSNEIMERILENGCLFRRLID